MPYIPGQETALLAELPKSKREPASECMHMGGTARTYKFPNGFGASVVRHFGSYGGDQGLFELAVLGSDGHLTYDTSVTDDVIGWLTWDEVEQLLDKIEAL